MHPRLQGAVAVVTGGGAGIGAATAKRFAQEGANVAVVDVDAEAARETADAVEATEATGDSRAIALEADVSDEGDVERVASACAEEFGSVDVLVNNAAIRVEPGPLTGADSDDIDAILGVNLKGAIYCSKHLIPLMGEGGAVVNVASVGAQAPREGWSLYDATKGALLAMTRDMARDHAADGIRVNAISPGWAITDHHIGDRDEEEAAQFLEEKTTPHEDGPGALRRAAYPGEIADGICYLASDEASYVTGTNLEIDGGGL